MTAEGAPIDQIIMANELALARAHIVFPFVIEVESRTPEWLIRLSTEAGVKAFEEKHRLEMPRTLRQFYKSARLISLLQAAWGVDVFLEGMDDDDPPGLMDWNSMPHIVIGYYPHGDSICAAEMIGERQLMFWEGVSVRQEQKVTLAEWVRGAAERLLR